MKYAQDVDWKEVAKLPEFVGTTPTYLGLIYHGMQALTGAKYKRMSKVELTTEAVQSYMEKRETSNIGHERQKEKKEEYRTELISFYLSNIVG